MSTMFSGNFFAHKRLRVGARNYPMEYHIGVKRWDTVSQTKRTTHTSEGAVGLNQPRIETPD